MIDSDVKSNENVDIKAKVTAKGLLSLVFQRREFSLILLIIAVCVFLSFAHENFLSSANMRIIVLGFSTDMIIATSLTILLIAGRIDFSVGSVLGFAGMVCALMLNSGMPIPLAIMGGLVSGALLGLINGLIVTYLKLLPMVATIGTWMAIKALTLVVSNGRTAASLPVEFKAIGQGSTLGIPNNIIFMAVILAIGIFALKHIGFFHQAYYIGGNEKSAELAGINVKRFTIVMYMISGLVSAFAGILLISRLGNAGPTTGNGTEFRLIVALLIGGVSFVGGEGMIVGAALGVVLMGLVQNALVMLSVSPYLNDFIAGAVLIFAVALDTYMRGRRRRV